jgi:predicted RNase H-like HicB family nuclease
MTVTLPHWLVGSILKQAGLTKGFEAMTEYLAIIEPAEDGSGFGAYVPDLPGCVATGQTREEAKERIAFSIPRHIASLRAHGETVPPPAAEAERITVAA